MAVPTAKMKCLTPRPKLDCLPFGTKEYALHLGVQDSLGQAAFLFPGPRPWVSQL